MNTIEAVKVARSIGISVEPVRRTDELRFTSPFIGKRVVTKATRKDASRAVMVFLRRHRERATEMRAAG